MLASCSSDPSSDDFNVLDGPGFGEPVTGHIVSQNETLAEIANQYGVSVDEIVALNQLTNPDLILIGQELRIPVAPPQ